MRFKKIFLTLLLIIISISLIGCTIDDRHVDGTYGDDENENIQDWNDINGGTTTDWENVDIVTWNETDEISQWVNATLIFDDITDEYASVTTTVLDYKSNGIYFDSERVYKLVGKQFDLNPLIAKFAIGTGVIVVCVVLNVVTYGAATPVACFIAGAAEGAISAAVKGAAMGAAMGAISSAIKSDGDWKDTLYGTVEGATSGYMWGAVFGAISGGINSSYCFTEDTEVLTSSGMMSIADIQNGDWVYSYDEVSKTYSYQQVTQKSLNLTYDTIKIFTENDSVESTLKHPYLTKKGWIEANDIRVGDLILTNNGEYERVLNVQTVNYDDPIKVYNMSINNNHTYVVGNDNLVVHNKCNINSEYAGKKYEFEKGSNLSKKYPNGVNFSSKGYPDFSPYAKKTLIFDYPSKSALANGTCLNGNYNHDFALANKMAGYGNLPSSTPAGYTWHHDESMQRLLLIPQDLHRAVRHTGGASLIKSLLSMLA